MKITIVYGTERKGTTYNIAKEVVKNIFRVHKWFFISRIMQKRFKLNPPDVAYWEKQGWTGKARQGKTLAYMMEYKSILNNIIN